MAFANAHNTTVYGSHFTDIQGDYNIYNVTGPISVNSPEPGLQALLKVIYSGGGFDSQERYPPPRCHAGTRVGILDEIFRWFDAGPAIERGPVLWLHGPAGAGKSAIAQTICERAAERGNLAASLFFSRGKRDESARLFATIAFQLAMSIPGHRVRVQDAIDRDPLVIHKATGTQIQKLIVEPLQAMWSDSDIVHAPAPQSACPSLVVIDGLDECKGSDAQVHILTHILDLVQNHFTPLRFMIVSRPEPHLDHCFNKTGLSSLTTEISISGDRQSREDVRTYLVAEFERMYCSERHSIIFSNTARPFPSPDDVKLLVDRSEGYFIYASTIIQFLDEEFFSPVDRLEEVINATSSRPSPFAELDALYHQVLSTNPNTALVNQILGVLVWHPSPTLGEICYLLDLSPERVLLNLRGLHSVVTIMSFSDAEPLIHRSIFPTHKSLCDFLLDASRAGKHYIDFQKIDGHLSLRHLDVLQSWAKVYVTSDSHLTRQLIVKRLVALVRETSTHAKSIIERLGAIDSGTWLLLMKHHRDLSVSESAKDSYDHGYWSMVEIFNYGVHLLQDLNLDLTARILTLRDMAYRVYVPAKSPDESLVYHSICALYGDLREVHIFQILGVHDLPHDVHLMARAIMDLLMKIPSRAILQKFGSPVNPSAYFDFKHYMTDVTRCVPCGELGRHSEYKRPHYQSTATEYQYARLYWALHLSRADHTNHAHLTHLLEHVPRSYLIDTEYFSSAMHDAQQFEETSDKPVGSEPFLPHQKDPRPKSVWILNSFHPQVQKASDYLDEFRKDDHAKARLVLSWLEAIDNPPPRLLAYWRAYYREISLELAREIDENDAIKRLDRHAQFKINAFVLEWISLALKQCEGTNLSEPVPIVLSSTIPQVDATSSRATP
ncbi:hypothetical protein LshimejAT787_0409120 [Lyophyllum shimeji]|uniref:Nephrocystin 3-like N-terminal domain-containing protein n=1 Tax=Lyophyllum shimeji TaxID=47721 RepID=A0A9P3PM66_LYOSH|nr:hypothetical protein LshimejAT787_0409120 [Lyophyllum shimeji]